MEAGTYQSSAWASKYRNNNEIFKYIGSGVDIGLVPLLRASKQIVRSMEYIFRAKHSRRMITGIHWQVVSMMKECPFRRFGII